MTEDELYALVAPRELFEALDIKTLALDIVREMNQDELLALVLQKLPHLSRERVQDYFFMQRS